MEVIEKLGISTEQLLMAPRTPPLPGARAAPRTPPDEAAVSALQSLLAPGTPPATAPRPKESPGVRMFVSSLEQVAQESGHLARRHRSPMLLRKALYGYMIWLYWHLL